LYNRSGYVLFILEWQLLFLVGWLSRGAGWYRFHDAILFEHDDPPCGRIFRYFL